MSPQQFRECVQMELNAIRMNLEGLDSTIKVCAYALQGMTGEIDEDISNVLAPISTKIQEARVHVSNIVSFLQRETNGNNEGSKS